MDSDRILVMDTGEIAEIGRPHELLEKLDGHLRNLVEQTGTSSAITLKEIASKKSQSKKDQ